MRDTKRSDLDDFNPEDVLRMIAEIRMIGRRKAFKQSKLNPYRSELVALRISGGSLADLATWLRLNTNITADKTTISRFLKKLPELQNVYKEENSNGEI